MRICARTSPRLSSICPDDAVMALDGIAAKIAA
jgi:hypothetical protein